VETSRVIVDSNVLVSAFTSAEGASRQVLRRVLNGEAEALISLPLFAEYEAVLGRPETQRRCPLTAMEQTQLLDAFLSRTRLVEVYYRWRPNLPDEGDNHVLELAVAASDAPIVTFNRRDFRSGELRFPGIIVQTPGAWLKSLTPLKE
jgi:putative PIN family toxin of toxin-antitoxin system